MKRYLPMIVIGLVAAALVAVMVATLDESPTDLGPAPPAPPAPDRPYEPTPLPPGDPGDPGADGQDAAAVGMGAIEGVVRERETGRPVAGAAVRAVRSRWNRGARTGSAGEFRLEDVPAGNVSIRVSTPDHVDPPARTVAVENGRTTRAEFDLETGLVVVGRVTDSDTGAAIAEALVSVLGSEEKVTTADTDGDFRLLGLKGGRVTFAASAPAYPETRTTVTVPEGLPEFRQDLSLSRGAVVRGIVKDDAGVGVGGAAVTLRGFPPSGAETDASGAFELPAVPVDRAVWVTAEKDGYVPARSGELRFGRGEVFDGLELALSRGGTVRGRVRLADGSPAAGVTVTLVMRSASRFVGRAPRTTTAEDGTFSLSPVAAGDHQLVASRRDALQARVDVPGVAEGGVVDGVELVLDTGRTITGVVRDEAGKPMAGAFVTARPVEPASGARWGNAKADAEGRFTLTALVAGNYELVARPVRGGRSSAPVTVPAGAEDVDLRLPVPGGISGVVTDSSGRPVTSYTVRARASERGAGGGLVFERVNSPDGRFRLEGLAPGTYVLEVSATAGYGDPVDGISVPAGGEVSGISIVLEPAGRITGRVYGEDGSPAVGARVGASTNTGGLGATGGGAAADDRGEFEVVNLRPGTYRVTASRDGLLAMEEGVEVVAGGEVRVTLRFPATGALTVRVSSSDGGAVAGATVQLRTASGAWVPVRVPDLDESVPPDERAARRREAMTASVRTDARGICERPVVPEGDLVVRVVAAGFEDAEATARAVAGRTTEVRVVMQPGESSQDAKNRLNPREGIR